MPYKAKPSPWIRTEDIPFNESTELMCPWRKACPCWCRKRRWGSRWEIRPTEREHRWEQNYELMRVTGENREDTPADTYGSVSGGGVVAVGPLEP